MKDDSKFESYNYMMEMHFMKVSDTSMQENIRANVHFVYVDCKPCT